ncbi:MAG: hypothetical protein NVS1B14_01180 [Vulcanimicrobiaceae bacterium]
MPKPSSPEGANFSEAHPMAIAMASRLRRGAHVLEIGAGSGRNTRALRAAGMVVTSIGNSRKPPAALPRHSFDGALSTHALLHGSPSDIAEGLEQIAAALKSGGLFFTTFASRKDARFGKGERLGPNTFAAATGDESGIAHSYFDGDEVRALLAGFKIESLREVEVDQIVGRWAHAKNPLRGAVHWFAIATAK